MTEYDDDAERLGEECELCGEIGERCRCDEATATEDYPPNQAAVLRDNGDAP